MRKRLIWLIVGASASCFVSCDKESEVPVTDSRETQEEPVYRYESSTTVSVAPPLPLLGSKSDDEEALWADRLAIFESADFLSRVSNQLKLNEEQVGEAVSAEARIDEREILIRAKGSSSEEALFRVDEAAATFVTILNEQEESRLLANLRRLEVDLKKQESVLEKNRDQLEMLLQEYGLTSPPESVGEKASSKDGTLEQDRLTYEKAKKALNEHLEAEGLPLLGSEILPSGSESKK